MFVATVKFVMTIVVYANFALNKVTVTLKMTITLVKVSAAPYANVAFAL